MKKKKKWQQHKLFSSQNNGKIGDDVIEIGCSTPNAITKERKGNVYIKHFCASYNGIIAYLIMFYVFH